MRIAIASGKGGAGKTSVTASLVRVWDGPHIAADCDAEAPNLHLFLNPLFRKREVCFLKVPARIAATCSQCGRCRDMCRYGAIARFGKKIVLFPEMCHGCGGCFEVCPEGALEEGQRELGVLSTGLIPGQIPYIMGTTRVGEVMTPPLLRRLLQRLGEMEKEYAGGGEAPVSLLDCPPGVSCPAITVATHSDALLMVVDPTPFGFQDFTLAYAAFRDTGSRLACVINRTGTPGNGDGDEKVRAFCREKNLPLLAELPFGREAAEGYSRGRVLADLSPAWNERFRDLARALRKTFMEQPHA